MLCAVVPSWCLPVVVYESCCAATGFVAVWPNCVVPQRISCDVLVVSHGAVFGHLVVPGLVVPEMAW